MMISLDYIESVMQKKRIGLGSAQLSGFSIDSREINQGDCFIAIAGNRSDGHHFLQEAFHCGAVGCLIEEEKIALYENLSESIKNNTWCIPVHDVKKALFLLAEKWRNELKAVVVAITGSVGKTTTKDLLGNILMQSKKRVTIAQGSQNGSIGVPLTLLRARKDDEYLISEIGIQKPGEMEPLAKLIRPNISLITQIGNGQHMEYFRTKENLIFEKMILAKYATEKIVCNDVSIQEKDFVVSSDRVAIYQISKDNFFGYVYAIVDDGQFKKKLTLLSDGKVIYSFSVFSMHSGFIKNIFLAAFTAHLCGIPGEKIESIGERLRPSKERFFPLIDFSGKTIVIEDAFNASYDSFVESITSLEKYNFKKIVLCIGDMRELGEKDEEMHINLVRHIRNTISDSLHAAIIVGKNMRMAFESEFFEVDFSIHFCAGWEEALPFVQSFIGKVDGILLKSARGMGIRNIVPSLGKIIMPLHEWKMSSEKKSNFGDFDICG